MFTDKHSDKILIHQSKSSLYRQICSLFNARTDLVTISARDRERESGC